MRETWIWSLGRKYSLEEGMAAHSSILAWRIPWTEELGGLQSMGSQRVRHNCMSNTFTFFQVLILHHLHRVPPHTHTIWTPFLSSQGALISNCLPHTSNQMTLHQLENVPWSPMAMPFFQTLFPLPWHLHAQWISHAAAKIIPRAQLCFYHFLAPKS